jgi:hypothetical protein
MPKCPTCGHTIKKSALPPEGGPEESDIPDEMPTKQVKKMKKSPKNRGVRRNHMTGELYIPSGNPLFPDMKWG